MTIKEIIMNAEVPAKTKTYCPIPHSVFLEEIVEKLTNNNISIKSEYFASTAKGEIIRGTYKLAMENSYDADINPSISFVNSYNKMRKASVVSGVMVLVCANGMMRESGVNNSRKHSGDSALEDFRAILDTSINSLESEFDILRQNMQEMKNFTISDKHKASMMGDMYLNYEMITPSQLAIFKKEDRESKNFTDDTVWSFYNNITESLKVSHPLHWDRDHAKVHSYISSQFDLTGDRKLYPKLWKD